MRRALATGLLLALVACKSTGVTAPKGPKASTAVTASAASATPAPAAAPAFLQRPADTAAFSGTVQIDASYVISNHAASLVSNNGSQVLAAGGAIISEHGGGLVSDHGVGVIANNAGNVIANNSGGLVGKNKYALAQAETPTYGAQLPAAGMTVRVLDMNTGKALPLGADAAGKPVDTVYTNMKGGFEVYLPANLATNVRVEVAVPDHPEPRLTYHLIAAPAAQNRTVDEDTATATRYMRQVLQQKFANLIAAFDRFAPGGVTNDKALLDSLFTANQTDPAAQALVRGFAEDILSEVHANAGITQADYQAVGLLLGDELLAQGGDFDAIQISPLFFSGKDQADAIAADSIKATRVMDAFLGVIADERKAVTALGRGKTPDEVAALFAAKPYLAAANKYHARLNPQDPAPYYVIRKPSDFADFLAQEYLTMVDMQDYGCHAPDCPPPDPSCKLIDFCFPEGGVAKVGHLTEHALTVHAFQDVGLPTEHVQLLAGATQSLMGNLVARALDPEVNARLHCLIRGFGKADVACP